MVTAIRDRSRTIRQTVPELMVPVSKGEVPGCCYCLDRSVG
jgi:hypothetical protein